MANHNRLSGEGSLVQGAVRVAGVVGHEAFRLLTFQGFTPEVAYSSEHAILEVDDAGRPVLDDKGERVFRLQEPGDLPDVYDTDLLRAEQWALRGEHKWPGFSPGQLGVESVDIPRE